MLRLVWTNAGKTVSLGLGRVTGHLGRSLVYVGTVVRDYDVEAIDPNALEETTPRGEAISIRKTSNWKTATTSTYGLGRAGQQLECPDPTSMAKTARPTTQVHPHPLFDQQVAAEDADGVQAFLPRMCTEKGIASIAEVGAGGFRSRINKILLRWTSTATGATRAAP